MADEPVPEATAADQLIEWAGAPIGMPWEREVLNVAADRLGTTVPALRAVLMA